MVTEEQKQLAGIFKIGGFALMTPLGQIILSIPKLGTADLNLKLFLYALLALLFFYLGIILLVKSLEAVTVKMRKSWIQ